MAKRHKGTFEVEHGFGLPRKTTAQVSAYTPEAIGYQVFNTTTGRVEAWNGVTWKALADLPELTSGLAEKVDTSGSTMTGALVLTPGQQTASDHAATRGYVDGLTGPDANKVDVTGDTMTGDLVFSGAEITGLPATPAVTGAASKEYVDAQVAGGGVGTFVDLTTAQDVGGLKTLTAGVAFPTTAIAKFGPGGEIYEESGSIYMQSSDDEDTQAFVCLENGNADFSSGATDALNSKFSTLGLYDATAGGNGVVLYSTDTIQVQSVTKIELGLEVGAGSIEISTSLVEISAGTSGYLNINSAQINTSDDANIVKVLKPATFASTVLLAADPTLGLQAATKDYVDAAAATAGAATDLGELTDVFQSAGLNGGNFLVKGGDGNWLDRLLLAADIPDISASYGTAAQGALADSALQDLTTTSINELSDVDTSTVAPTTGQALIWNGTDFVPSTLTGGADRVLKAGDTMTGDLAMAGNEVTGLPAVPSATAAASKEYVDAQVSSADSLDELSDTTITAAADGDFLRHNGTDWVDATILATDIPDISATYATAAQGVKADTAVQPATLSSYVTIGGIQTITGAKTFSSDMVIANTSPELTFNNTSGSSGVIQFAASGTDTTALKTSSVNIGLYNDTGATESSFVLAQDVGTSTLSTSLGILGSRIFIDDGSGNDTRIDLKSSDGSLASLRTSATGITLRNGGSSDLNFNVEDDRVLVTNGQIEYDSATVDADEALALVTKGWVEGKLSIAGAAQATDDLTDVDTSTTTPVALHTLIHDGTTFVNRLIGQSDVTDLVSDLAGKAAVVHTHTKADVTDFAEADYVHVLGDETIGGNKTFSNDVEITGNLTVQGTTTTVNSTDLDIEDSIIRLNKGEQGAGVTSPTSAGLEIERGTLPNAYLVFDEATQTIVTGYASSAGAGVAMDTATKRTIATVEYVDAGRHVATFVTGDWAGAGPYTYTVDAATHGLDLTDKIYHVTVMEAGEIVSIETEINQTSGDVVITTTGAVFDGKIRISL